VKSPVNFGRFFCLFSVFSNIYIVVIKTTVNYSIRMARIRKLFESELERTNDLHKATRSQKKTVNSNFIVKTSGPDVRSRFDTNTF